MADFGTAYQVLEQNEGGYANNSSDAGGETYRGIARNYHPNWTGWTWIDNYKYQYGPIPRGTVFPQLESDVQQFVYENFWVPIQGDSIQNQQLANMVLDFCYESGHGPEQINLALGLPGTNSITSDTVNAMNADPVNAFNAIKQQRLNYYENLNQEGYISDNLIQGVLDRVRRLASPTAIAVTGGAAAVIALLVFFF